MNDDDPGTIPAGTQVTNVETTEQVRFADDIHTDVNIIPDDPDISTFTHNGSEYSVWSDDVSWDV